MRKFIESSLCQKCILVVVCIDSIALGLLSLSMFWHNEFLLKIDEWCLHFFVAEMCLKLLILRKHFFKSGWNLFDFIVVGLSALPFAIGNISILRFLRIIKVMRLFSVTPQLRFIIAVISKSIPSIVCIGVLLLFMYYVYAVLGTQLFAEAMPKYFGDLGKSFFTLFQIMTGESWSESVARPTMEVYPYSWIYFISFIIVVSFIVLNMIIGIIVDSIDEVRTNFKKDMTKSSE